MPIYEYECGACGHHLEAIQKMSDAALTDCPECHKATLQKLVSAAGFQLKGTGWYVTDFRNKGAQDKTSSGTDASSKTGGAESGKSDNSSSSSSSGSTDSKAG